MSAQERSKGGGREPAAAASEVERPPSGGGGTSSGATPSSAAMSAATLPSSAPALGSAFAAAAADPELQRIRDILFGEQVRLLERRMSDIEERNARELAALKQEQQARLSSMEARLKT